MFFENTIHRLAHVFASTTLASATLACVLPATAFAQESCLTFDGLTHCPEGRASLRLSRTGETLAVRTSDSSGRDGVAIRFDGARSWSSVASFRGDGGRDARLVSTALADGFAVSTATMSRNGSKVELGATFTGSGSGSTYSVLIYRDGVLKASSGGNPNGSAAIDVFSPCLWLGGVEGDICDLVWEFRNSPGQSRCEWGLVSDELLTFRFPNGKRVRGDEVQLVEEISPNGGYPYLSFDEIVLRGTGDAIRLHSESINP